MAFLTRPRSPLLLVRVILILGILILIPPSLWRLSTSYRTGDKFLPLAGSSTAPAFEEEEQLSPDFGIDNPHDSPLHEEPNAYPTPDISSPSVPTSSSSSSSSSSLSQPTPELPSVSTACPDLPLADEVLLILRTGATEAHQRMPAHFDTTLRCPKHSVIFSDLDETINGHHLIDVLSEVNETIQNTNPDFEFYKHMRAKGRAALTAEDLAKWSSVQNSAMGKQANPAWKIDKWKFMPAIDRAVRLFPSVKWYVLIEGDTHVVWSNLLGLLARWDASTPLYIGSPMCIGKSLFGYGGSSLILSNPAATKMATYRKEHLEELDKKTADAWAGDEVLGSVLRDVGVPLTSFWPSLQSESFAIIDYAGFAHGKRMGCFTTVTHHHLKPDDLTIVNEIQQRWFSKTQRPLRHIDLFKDGLLPEIRTFTDGRPGWDNLAGRDNRNPEGPAKIHSFEDCRRACQERDDCMMFSYVLSEEKMHDKRDDDQTKPQQQQNESGHICYTNTNIKVGMKVPADYDGASHTVTSGWMNDRIDEMVRGIEESCGDFDGWLEEKDTTTHGC